MKLKEIKDDAIPSINGYTVNGTKYKTKYIHGEGLLVPIVLSSHFKPMYFKISEEILREIIFSIFNEGIEKFIKEENKEESKDDPGIIADY